MTFKEIMTDTSVKHTFEISAFNLGELLERKTKLEAKDLQLVMTVDYNNYIKMFLNINGNCYDLTNYHPDFKIIESIEGEILKGHIHLQEYGNCYSQDIRFETPVQKCLCIDTGYRGEYNGNWAKYAWVALTICRIFDERTFSDRNIDTYDCNFELVYTNGDHLDMKTKLVRLLHSNGEIVRQGYAIPNIVSKSDEHKITYEPDDSRTNIYYTPAPSQLIKARKIF